MTSETALPHRPSYRRVPVEELEFDPNNPRFGGSAVGFTQPEIQDLLEQNPHYARELVPSLMENGFIAYEPLVVREKGDRYVVIEGNRRLAAVRYILEHPQEISQEIRNKFAKIPVLVFSSSGKDAARQEAIRVYLGIHHLFGFREWPAESKAKFLDQNITTAADLQKLVKEMGFGKSELERYLIPYRIRKHAEKQGDSVPAKDFWTLGEALNRSGIKEYLELEVDSKTLQIEGYNRTRLKFLLGFLYGSRGIEKRITDTRQVGLLAKVLSSKKASEALERGASLEEAQLYVQSKHKTAADLAERLDSLLRRIYKLRPKEPEMDQIVDILESYLKKFRG